MAETVVLSCVDYSLPKGLFLKFNRLKKLFLYDCMVNQSDLQSTVSNSMFLESLILVCCEGLTIFKISKEALKEVVILPLDDDMSIRELEINAPNLLSLMTKNLGVQLRFTNCCRRLVRALFQNERLRGAYLPGFYIRQLLSQLHHLQFLATDIRLPRFLDEALYKNGKRFSEFNNLKELCFLCYDMSGPEIALWLNFLHDCPFLKKIQLEFAFSFFVDEVHLRIPQDVSIRTREDLMELEMYPDVEYTSGEDELKHSEPLKELKCIELFRFIESRRQMEMVKRFLKKTSNLEMLSLIYSRDSEPLNSVMKPKLREMISQEDRILLQEQISQLPRASLDVKFSLF